MTVKKLLKGTLLAAAMATAALLAPVTASAEYPTKPITLVAPYGPGGASDLASRTLASVVPAHVGQPVLVVNRTGAGGVTGSTFVNKAKPDGYTLLLARIGCNAVTPALNATIPYTYDQFTMLGLLELNPFVYVVKADSPFKTLQDLVDALKAKPGTLNYSTSGPGTLLNMGAQMLFETAGLKSDAATMVPYKGGGGAATALVGGHVDFLGINLAPVLSHIGAGTLRALAVTTPKRFAAIPKVPTVREVGFPELENIIGWSALFGPPGMSQEAIDKWTAALAATAKDKAWLSLVKKLGSIPSVRTPADTRAFVDGQYKVYHTLGEKLGLLVK